jgi:hypothetical protein
MTESAANNGSTDIVAKPGREYRWRRYAFVALMLIFGIAFAYDGFVRYPAQQAQFNAMSEAQKANAEKPHSDLDVRLQKILAVAMIPFAAALLGYFLYQSRGVCRLSDGVLYVPGHPPVPLEHIRALDKSLWDRKGIAEVEYQFPQSSGPSTLRLDEFVYQYQPIRQIMHRIENHLDPGGETGSEADEKNAGA